MNFKPAWIPLTETSSEIAQWLSPQLDGSETVVVQLHGEPVPELSGAIVEARAELIEIQSYEWDFPEIRAPLRS